MPPFVSGKQSKYCSVPVTEIFVLLIDVVKIATISILFLFLFSCIVFLDLAIWPHLTHLIMTSMTHPPAVAGYARAYEVQDDGGGTHRKFFVYQQTAAAAAAAASSASSGAATAAPRKLAVWLQELQ